MYPSLFLPILCIAFLMMGACVGSFAGVLLEKRITRSCWFGRSQCMNCKRHLQWYELIPLLSYIGLAGKCRTCHASIPWHVLGIEVLFASLWGVFGILFSLGHYSLGSSVGHLIILSGIALLAWEDIRSGTIPDRFSLPLLGISIGMLGIMDVWQIGNMLPAPLSACLGMIVGMLFYLLQIMIPGISASISNKKFSSIIPLLLLPILFPSWLLVKMLRGEKKADALFPTLQVTETLPAWVGGGDLRLGMLIGLISGPMYFWWIVAIGYTCGTLLYGITCILSKKRPRTLPVAPLLFVGLIVLWGFQLAR